MRGMTNNEAATKSSDEVVLGKPPIVARPKTTNSVLKEITKDQNRAKSSGKKTRKDEWDRYFAFINDKERDKLMQIPDLPKQSRRVSKSAHVKRSRSMNNVGQYKDESKEPRDERRDQAEKRNTESKTRKKLSFEDEPKRNKRNSGQKAYNDDNGDDEFKNNCEFKTPEFKNLHESKSKPEICGKLHNHKSSSILRKSTDSDNADALTDAHFNTAYKNLVRSLRANL